MYKIVQIYVQICMDIHIYIYQYILLDVCTYINIYILLNCVYLSTVIYRMYRYFPYPLASICYCNDEDDHPHFKLISTAQSIPEGIHHKSHLKLETNLLVMEQFLAFEHKSVSTDIRACAHDKPGILYMFFCIVHTLDYPSQTNRDCENTLLKDRKKDANK